MEKIPEPFAVTDLDSNIAQGIIIDVRGFSCITYQKHPLGAKTGG